MSAVERVNPVPVMIRLRWSEVMLAAHVGTMRRVFALQHDKAAAYGARDEGAWDNDINGAAAEMACAKWVNTYWNGTIGITSGHDVGGLIGVRSCTPGRRLILHPRDQNEAPFVLAWVRVPPLVELCGWMLASEGKQQEFWCDPSGTGRPAYFVPAGKLHSMATLREWADDNLRGLWEDIECAS
jgi:hypothetical protein